jgi:protocatechuate 3,4-dioxygenase beta subunit
LKRALPILLVLVLLVGGVIWYLSRPQAAPAVKRAPAATPTLIKKAAPPVGESGAPPRLQLAFDDDPAGSLRLEGRVEDADGNSVGGATVSISTVPPRQVTTEADGSFAFTSLLPRTYAVDARQGNRHGGPIEVRVSDQPEPLRIQLAAAVTLELTVEEAGSKAVMAGASVEARQASDAIAGLTDRTGVARIEGLSPGVVTLKVSAPGHAPSFEILRMAAVGGGVEQHTITLEQGVALAGKVVDGRGKPVVGARVLAVAASSLFAPQDARKDSIETDSKGHFAFAALPAGYWMIMGMY